MNCVLITFAKKFANQIRIVALRRFVKVLNVFLDVDQVLIVPLLRLVTITNVLIHAPLPNVESTLFVSLRITNHSVVVPQEWLVIPWPAVICQWNLAKTTSNAVPEVCALMEFARPNASAPTRIVFPMKYAKVEYVKEFAATTINVEITKFALIECASKGA
jgi:hypothetical protein